MKFNIKKIRKKKLKGVKAIEQQFKPEIYRVAALSAGTEFRSVEVNLEQEGPFPVLVEISGVLQPENIPLDNVQPTRIARTLELHGLQTAVVVTTDDLVLGGHPGWINLVKYHTQLPVIARDFFFHPVQVYQARATGADAVIVDLRWIDNDTATELVNAVFEMGMEPIVQLSHPEFPESLDREIVTMALYAPEPDATGSDLAAQIRQLKSQHGGKLHVIVETDPANLDKIAELPECGATGVLLNSQLLVSENYLQQFSAVVERLGLKRS